MAKKQKKPKPRGWIVSPSQVDRWLSDATLHLAKGDYERVIVIGQRILSYTPGNAPQRVDALRCLANAHAMLKHFEESYEILSEAVQVAPDESDLWYNLGLSARFTSRTAESVFALERAVALEAGGELSDQFTKELAFARRIAESERASRGRHFTLEQLRQQQNLFQHAMNLMGEGLWEQAEREFREVIAMGDVLPQPQGNLGLVLMLQRRFDEAEAALRRALEIDPNYALARSNLASLPGIRESGELPQVAITSPFHDVRVSQTLHFTGG